MNKKDLQTQLQASTDPIERIRLGNALAWELRLDDEERAWELASAALAQAENVGGDEYVAGMAESRRILGYLSLELGKPEQALDHFFKAQSLYEELGELRRLASITNMIGTIFGDSGNYPEAIEYIQRAYKTAVRAADHFSAREQDLREELKLTIVKWQESEALKRTHPLTGLQMYKQFVESAQREADRARRYNHPLSLIVVDIDHFKDINDTHGHITGDEVLKMIGAELSQLVRDVDVLGHYGADQFIALLPETTDEQACGLARRIARGISGKTRKFEFAEFPVTLSVGISSLDFSDEHIDSTIQRAEQAVLAAKEAGRNRIAIKGFAYFEMVEMED